MKTFYCLFLLLTIGISACTDHETPKDVPFEMLPDGLKKKVEAELMEDMKREVIEYNEELHNFFSTTCFWPCDIEVRNFLDITRDSAGIIDAQDEITENDSLQSFVRIFYLSNEELSPQETISSIQDPTSPFYEFPYYSRLTTGQILEEIKKNKKELDRATTAQEDDYIEFYRDLLEKWERKLEVITVLDVEELVEIHPQVQIRIDDALNAEGLSTLTIEVIKGLIQVRDYASRKYLGTPYLDLYFEATRFTDSKASEKLNAINFLYPIKITDYSYAELNNLGTGRVFLEEVELIEVE